MARTRYIKPGFFKNEQLCSLEPLTRLLFAGLWTIADRDGRLEDRPLRIKVECLPYDDADVDDLLSRLSNGYDPFILRYEIEGRRYIQIVKWPENQSPHHTEKDSVIPCVPDSYETPLDNGYLTSCSLKGTKVPRYQGTKVPREEKGGSLGGVGRKQVSAADVPVPESFETPEARQALADWIAYKAKRGEAYKDAGFIGRKVKEYAEVGPAAFIAAVDSSIGNNYSGLFSGKDIHGNSKTSSRVGPGQRYQGD